MHDPRPDPPSGSAWDEHERDTHQRDRERRDRPGRERVRSRFGEHRHIGGLQRHVERPGDHPVRDHERREEHHEVSEAPEDRERENRSPSQGHDQRDGGEEVHGLRDVDEGRRPQIGRGVADRSVEAGQGIGRLGDRQNDAEQHDAEEPPRPPLPADSAHERRRLTRGSAAATGLLGTPESVPSSDITGTVLLRRHERGDHHAEPGPADHIVGEMGAHVHPPGSGDRGDGEQRGRAQRGTASPPT